MMPGSMDDLLLDTLGLAGERQRKTARACIAHAEREGLSKPQLLKRLRQTLTHPEKHLRDPFFAPLALTRIHRPAIVEKKLGYVTKSFQQWGNDLDPEAVEQMKRACSLPITVRGALMPDAHVGYGLPIGGVLAADNAVVPYAVGVDIACRMKLTVLDLPPEMLEDQRKDRLRFAIENETRFGVGVEFRRRRSHAVMDLDWNLSPVTQKYKDKAWAQLGTSGSGNHFVEFGIVHLEESVMKLAPGQYLALMTHSGSRGTGAEVCSYYSKIAQNICKNLTPQLRHLAWLDMDTQAGREYWAAMELMGRYAAANHELIHRHIAENLGAQVLLDIENHHNFAWRERHDGRTVIVHRKGATPAGRGVLGIIPGSMASPAYIVRGKGNPLSLESASHGAGRLMSRTAAKKALSWASVKSLLDHHQITLLSAGIDEAPMAYKNIDAVMAFQRDLVEIIAVFYPRLVKMAPSGERPED